MRRAAEKRPSPAGCVTRWVLDTVCSREDSGSRWKVMTSAMVLNRNYQPLIWCTEFWDRVSWDNLPWFSLVGSISLALVILLLISLCHKVWHGGTQ